MTNKNIYRSLGGLDPELVMKAAPSENTAGRKRRKRSVWVKWCSLAACLVLVVSSALAVLVLRERNLPDIPIWDTAQYSAEEISKMFDLYAYDSVATNAYKKIYVPDSKYLYIDPLTEENYVNLYKPCNKKKELNIEELQNFTNNFLPRLSESLNISVPQFDIEEKKTWDGEESYLYDYVEVDTYRMSVDQGKTNSSFSLYSFTGDRKISIDDEVVQIDQRLSDEEIIDSIQSVKNKLFDIFDVSFSDVKIKRSFSSYSKHGAERIEIYFYNENLYGLNVLGLDYISISFENQYASDDLIYKAMISYNKGRDNTDVNDLYAVVGKAKRISIEEAETLLYNGYVYGGHSCPLCMAAQDKVSFEGYDFVDIEYKFGYINESDESTIGIPFYAFYKKIGTSENGNSIYARTYVAAIELNGYDDYFASQKGDHRKNLD